LVHDEYISNSGEIRQQAQRSNYLTHKNNLLAKFHIGNLLRRLSQ